MKSSSLITKKEELPLRYWHTQRSIGPLHWAACMATQGTGRTESIWPTLELQHGDKKAAEKWIEQDAPRWDQLIKQAKAACNPEEAYLTFSRKWEHYLRAVFGPLQGGRGALAVADKGACKGRRRARLVDVWRTIRGKAIALQQLGSQRASVQQNMRQKLWTSAQRQLPQIDAKELRSRLADPEALLSFADQRWKEVQREERAQRRAAWKERMEAKDLREVCAQLRPSHEAPLTLLDDTEGKLTNPYDIMKAIRKA